MDSLHTRAQFAADNPDVLHSPAMYRALIAELLQVNRVLLAECKRLRAAKSTDARVADAAAEVAHG